jgi:GH15 family glucan-1,4-alpha-glucosidase
VEAHAYNEELGTYTQTYGGSEVDASLLLLPLYGFIAADDPRMRSTAERIRKELTRGSLVYRYRPTDGDGLPAGEAAFGICSFWAVEYLARSGDIAGARASFEQLLGYGNDLGLFAEEIEPDTGEQLGNFPQAFTHIGLINAALTLAEFEGKAPRPRREAEDRSILEVSP